MFWVVRHFGRLKPSLWGTLSPKLLRQKGLANLSSFVCMLPNHPLNKGGGGAYIDTMLYWLADRLLLLKCYDNKMVKLPSVGASSCSWPTKKNNNSP